MNLYSKEEWEEIRIFFRDVLGLKEKNNPLISEIFDRIYKWECRHARSVPHSVSGYKKLIFKMINEERKNLDVKPSGKKSERTHKKDKKERVPKRHHRTLKNLIKNTVKIQTDSLRDQNTKLLRA